MAPHGVRIVRGDTTIDCNLAYRGTDGEGVHEWEVTNTRYNPATDRIRVAVMPPRTAITFPSIDVAGGDGGGKQEEGAETRPAHGDS